MKFIIATALVGILGVAAVATASTVTLVVDSNGISPAQTT